MIKTQIEAMLRKAFPESSIMIEDMTGTEDHFEVVVESHLFNGKSLVEQHRMVYAALGSALDGPVHALKITTKERTDR